MCYIMQKSVWIYKCRLNIIMKTFRAQNTVPKSTKRWVNIVWIEMKLLTELGAYIPGNNLATT
jgi:hypothetical protein